MGLEFKNTSTMRISEITFTKCDNTNKIYPYQLKGKFRPALKSSLDLIKITLSHPQYFFGNTITVREMEGQKLGARTRSNYPSSPRGYH